MEEEKTNYIKFAEKIEDLSQGVETTCDFCGYPNRTLDLFCSQECAKWATIMDIFEERMKAIERAINGV